MSSVIVNTPGCPIHGGTSCRHEHRSDRDYAFDDVQRFIAEMLHASTPGGITHAIYSDMADDMERLRRIPGYTRSFGR